MKLEQFENILLIRPDKACSDSLSDSRLNEWRQKAHAEFISDGTNGGYWKKYRKVKDWWNTEIKLNDFTFSLKLKLTEFKHIGIFPEQSYNWNQLYQYGKVNPGAKILNLFAYTGGASIAGALGGSMVTHVESSSSTLKWAKENAELNHLSTIRWISDDAVRFCEREIKRENKYNLIILDPPVFGQCNNGKKWKLEKDLFSLMEKLKKILNKKNGRIILNTYSPRIGIKVLSRLQNIFPENSNITHSNLYIRNNSGKTLNCGLLSQISSEIN